MRVHPSAPYVSPVVAAREMLLSAERRNLSRRALATLRRIAQRLEPVTASDLAAQEAPFKVFRWVAWATSISARRARADLVLHLRSALPTRRGGWLPESKKRAAFDAWQREVEAARGRGLVQPRPEEVPLATYEAAVGEVARSARRSPPQMKPPPPPPPPLVLTDEERAALAALERLLKRVG